MSDVAPIVFKLPQPSGVEDVEKADEEGRVNDKGEALRASVEIIHITGEGGEVAIGIDREVNVVESRKLNDDGHSLSYTERPGF
jgi:hypothetical protein